MKNAKSKRRIHFEGVEYTYIQDYGADTMRIYDPETKQVWFELPTSYRPGEVKIEIEKALFPERYLNRVAQCAKCPWKLKTDPHQIPDGYCTIKHGNLSSTIAQEGVLNLDGPLHIMACHSSKENAPEACVGWLDNQLGPGNNIGLRLRAMSWKNIDQIRTFGDQHQAFEDTLPK